MGSYLFKEPTGLPYDQELERTLESAETDDPFQRMRAYRSLVGMHDYAVSELGLKNSPEARSGWSRVASLASSYDSVAGLAENSQDRVKRLTGALPPSLKPLPTYRRLTPIRHDGSADQIHRLADALDDVTLRDLKVEEDRITVGDWTVPVSD